MQKEASKRYREIGVIFLTILAILTFFYNQGPYAEDLRDAVDKQTNSNLEAIRRGRWPAQLQGATGSSRPSQKK